MSGKKIWTIGRGDLIKEPCFGKLHNPAKFKALADMTDSAAERAASPNQEKLKALSRRISEEVANIAQHNKSWNDMNVSTDINTTRTCYKYEIEYDGGQYHDPIGIKHILDMHNLFKSYNRQHTVAPDGTVKIKITVTLVSEE